MSSVGQTLFGFSGAILLAAGATAVDRALVDDGERRLHESEAKATPHLAPYSFRLTDRRVVFPLRFTDYASVARLIEPGSLVNVLVIIRDPGEPARQTAKLFMKNVRVREIRHPTEPVRGTPDVPVAMIEVTSGELDKLLVAQRVGVLSLVPARLGDPDSMISDYGGLKVTLGNPAKVRGPPLR